MTKEKRAEKMKKIQEKSRNAWNRLWKLENEFNTMKGDLIKRGEWEAFCQAVEQDEGTNFGDLGA